MQARETHQANRAAWNEAAARYEQEVDADAAFLRAGGTALHEPERRFLRDLGSWCGRAIHLQCAGGLDTLSLLQAGASEVVGVDISDRMIACARRKAELIGAPAAWYCCDILATPGELDSTADLVYTGKGALPWIMDLETWAAVVARLLRPGGCLYLYEGHPLDWVWDSEASELRIDLRYGGYFSRRVEVGQGWASQYIPADCVPPVEQQAPKYERQWTLGDILNALVGAGLLLERLEEHPDRFWNVLPNVSPDLLDLLPHTFSLLMRKPGIERSGTTGAAGVNDA